MLIISNSSTLSICDQGTAGGQIFWLVETQHNKVFPMLVAIAG